MSNVQARPYRDERSHRPTLAYPTSAEAHGHQWRWLAAGLALAFLIPFVLTDLTSINRDLYYGVFIGGVFAFTGTWLRFGVGSPRALVTRNWRAGVTVGLAFTAVMVAIVLNEPATPHPGGLGFVAAIAWRGVLYGLADGIILSAFPILAVFAAFAGARVLRSWRGKTAVGALALGVSLLFTAVYHLGYSDFRGEKLRKPLAGDVIWSLPTLATLSPLGSPITHAGLHVSAVVHSYETDVFLPPHAAALAPAPLERILDRAVTGPNRLAPGATAYVSGPDGSWAGVAGLADVSARTAMSADARLRLDSVSKIWTATLIYQLASGGDLRVSDTVARWLPGLLPYGDRLTIKQLLTHTSGLIDTNDIAADPDRYFARVTDHRLEAEIAATRKRIEHDPATEFSPRLWIRLAAYQPLLSEPGVQYHYSNIGFEILGLIAERATGQTLAELYRERIFTPLGLDSAAYDPQGPISGPHARGYHLDGTLTDMTAVHGGIGAEGGIVADAGDTARFLVALMQGKLVKPRELALMKNGGFWQGGEATGCGGVAYGHSGASAAYKANVWVSGDGRRVAVLLLNGRRDHATDARAGAAMTLLYCLAGSEVTP